MVLLQMAQTGNVFLYKSPSFETNLNLNMMYELDSTFKRYRRVHYYTGKYLYDPLMPYIKEAEILECVIQQRFLCFWFTIKKYQIINLNND